MHNSDDVHFNPFYIGPHPSQACAVPEAPVQQCSPDCQDGQDDPAKKAPAAPPAGQASKAQAAAAKDSSPDNPCPGGKMIECMQGGDKEKPCK